MSAAALRRISRIIRTSRIGAPGACLLAITAMLALAALPGTVDSASAGQRTPGLDRTVSLNGVRLAVPDGWQVVDLRAHPHHCIRFDVSAVYIGPAGDQAACPAHIVGGAAAIQLQPLSTRAVSAFPGRLRVVVNPEDLGALALEASGPVGFAVPASGVLLSLAYGPHDAALMRRVLAASHGEADRRPRGSGADADLRVQDRRPPGASVPGDYRGLGFDTCAAPAQPVMDAWRKSSGYASLGIYIGGVDMGCAQPNLTSAWVSRQVERGWHLLPVYVGRQAPCSGLLNPLSYDVRTARQQGQADAADAMAMATRRGIAAPSTLYSDMEGYDSSDQRCVAAVMSYLSGWTFAMHGKAYQAGVYSSASSGVHDLSLHYDDLGANRPDDLFMAWWNHRMDIRGGQYVPITQWRHQQRVHQYEGHTTETYGGHSLLIDRNFMDVSSVVPLPEGCPTSLDYEAYPLLRWPMRSDEVRTAQCLLATRGFDPGPATGVLNWRTTAAIRAFKASRALDSATSSLGSYAWTALLSGGTTEPLRLGSTGPYVRKVQRTLTARLETTVPIDGVFATGTQDAVQSYQRAVGLAPTGMVGLPTWRALQAGR